MTPSPKAPAGWSRRRWLQAWPAAAWAGASAAQASAPPATAPLVWPPLVTVHGQPVEPAPAPGVPVVVVFWATYCAFCERHNARIDKLWRTLDPSRLRVVGVALDRDAATVRQYLGRHGYRFPVVMDGGQLRRQFTPRRIMPMTCTVGADGRLLQCIPGEMAEDDVMELARLALPVAR